jgi:hypothetical protein
MPREGGFRVRERESLVKWVLQKTDAPTYFSECRKGISERRRRRRFKPQNVSSDGDPSQMREREVAGKRDLGEREREEQQTQTLPVVSLLITSCEFAITKIMAEITPIGSIDSHDISNPPHFFLQQLGRRRRRKTKRHHPKQREPQQQLQQKRERERERERASELPI